MTALTAAAAIATVIIELENRSRTMVSFYSFLALLQRILFNAHKICGVVFCCWVRTSSLRKGEVFHARSQQQRRERIVSFDAARFVIRFVLLVALFGELLFDGPWPRPHGRIFDRDDVLERGWPGPRPALDQVQFLARALKIGLRTEIRDVDYERIALPVATRVAVPLADVGRQVRTSVHDDVPLPPLPLTHVVEHRDAAWCLHNSAEAPAVRGSKFGQPSRQTAVRQRAVLRAIMAIHTRRVVARRKLFTQRRARRIVLPTVTGHRLGPARFGCLQQGETKFPLGRGYFLSLWCLRRNPA